MKRFCVGFVFCLTLFNSMCQNQEVGVSFRYGMPKSKLNFPTITTKNNGINGLYYKDIQTHNDKGVKLSHKFLVFKKIGLGLYNSIDFSKSTYYLTIVSYKSTYALENVKLNKSRLGFSIGLNEQLFLKKDKSMFFDLSFGAYLKLYKTNEKTFNSDFKYNNQDWIEYKYNIKMYHQYYIFKTTTTSNKLETNFSTWINLHLKTSLRNNLYLDMGIDFLFGLDYFYNFSYTVKEHKIKKDPNTGENINYISSVYNDLGFLSIRHRTNDFIYSSIGLTYKFNFKK